MEGSCLVLHALKLGFWRVGIRGLVPATLEGTRIMGPVTLPVEGPPTLQVIRVEMSSFSSNSLEQQPRPAAPKGKTV